MGCSGSSSSKKDSKVKEEVKAEEQSNNEEESKKEGKDESKNNPKDAAASNQSSNTNVSGKSNGSSSNAGNSKQSSSNNSSSNTANSSTGNKSSSGAKNSNTTFNLIVSKNLKGYFGEKSEVIFKKDIEVSEKKSLMDYLRENTNVSDKGGFICSINGYENLSPIPKSKMTEKQKKNNVMGIDWFVYVNGEKVGKGTNDIYPKKGDKIILDLHEWDKREMRG
ncbi:MAG TPA: hypothetical protein DEF85_04630 [Clostridiaceae bacterium]|nr:hypothetical protein [Clostridiaceae bacterium]HBG39094.1 hypothetical protein [Clostridiaceae bacterium]HBN28307.1 hypothetical protein [Clostridiaceae bacterium]HBX48159.1 hypothetical protein [Clostridiaceae bacterium]HCL49709.1 hypothetical protein [Clostridiaceae bacterium]